MSSVLDLLPDTIKECALHVEGGVCLPDEIVEKAVEKLELFEEVKEVSVEVKIEVIKEKTGCESQRCVVGKLFPKKDATDIFRKYFKIEGPTDGTLLSNINLDGIMLQWQSAFPTFFAYNFNMANWQSYSLDDYGRPINKPDTLATVKFADLMKEGFRCGGCIINSDEYQGRGKHWMALFFDARSKNRWSVEFFNSSGNKAQPTWVEWLEKMKEEMLEYNEGTINVDVIQCVGTPHQKSMSECGPYSLFYVFCRIIGVTPERIMEERIADKGMFEFRQHLFYNPNHSIGQAFNWEEYSRDPRNKIKWEPGHGPHREGEE